MALITKSGDITAEESPAAPKIEFPCENYVIKVVALESETTFALIVECMLQHAPDIDADKVSINRSSKGRFTSYSFRILATGEAQLAAMHKALMALDAVKVVM